MSTPYIRIDDLFSDRDLKLIDSEIDKLADKFTPLYFDQTQIYRIEMDDLFNNRRGESAILGILQGKLYSEEVRDIIKSHNDLSYTLYDMQHQFTTNISQLRELQEYRWHVDIHPGNEVKFMSFMWYANDDFGGGELIIHDGVKEHIIKPKRNMFILMPSYYKHKINLPVYEGKYNYRTTVNGFLKINRS